MKVLIVEDDKNMAQTVKDSLAAHSHTVDVSPDGADGSFLGRSYAYDAIILDYSSKKDGLVVCDEIRKAGKTTPILFMSVAGDTDIKVAAFKIGADDYITKPFSLDELHARINAVTRRSPVMKSTIISVGDLVLDQNTNSVKRGTRAIHLTRKEFHMLQYFMENAGIILSRAQIMEHIWTADGNPFSNTVEAHIRNLRKKLNENSASNLIINIPGRGYLIDAAKNISKLRVK